MEYKLLIVRNRYKGKLKIGKGLDWFKKNTPLKITTEEIKTDFDVTSQPIKNASYKGVICGADIYPKLRSVIPEGKYNAVVFVYGNKMDGIRVNAAPIMPLYPGTDLIQLVKTTDNGKALNHEIFHTFIHRLQRQQVMIEDPMDKVIVEGVVKHYYNDLDLDAKPSNRSIAMERISPYWHLVANILTLEQMQKVELKRVSDDGVQTLGELTAENYGAKFTCKTLELPYKNNAQNISCIPKGVYQVEWTFSPRFLRFTYEIKNVPGRNGIRIHPANYYFNLLGCIALGNNLVDLNKDKRLDVINSKATMGAFEAFMGKKKFTLAIV